MAHTWRRGSSSSFPVATTHLLTTTCSSQTLKRLHASAFHLVYAAQIQPTEKKRPSLFFPELAMVSDDEAKSEKQTAV